MIIGEVLFDTFPDGRRVLGGAPFNVAWNAQGLGLRPQFISAVGTDEPAAEVRQKMTAHQMELSGLQTDPAHGTGKVEVTFNDEHEPQYEIVPDQAYDFVQPQPILDWLDGQAAEAVSMIYHGSLIWRNPASRSAVIATRKKVDVPIFVDLNVRMPWFDDAWLDELLTGVRWLKLNKDELGQLSGQPVETEADIVAAVKTLQQTYACDSFFVTSGSKGAWHIASDGEVHFAAAPKPEKLVDTVGAGDAFSAATIVGLSQSLDIQTVLDRAVAHAARVCGLNGATTDAAGFYQTGSI